MPRDGSNIYSQPFPDVVEDTTIESTVYNGFTNDVAQDLNAPRPIVAGGTGATSASDARFNLAAEAAAQLVTNYDSHLWVPGSFRSAASATGAPNTNAFSGVCYIGEALANPPTNQNVVLEARDATDGKLYIRRKTAGTWSAWVLDNDLSGVTAAIALKVAKAGDTMTGPLVLPAAAPTLPEHATNKAYVDSVDTALATGRVRYDAAQTLTANQQAQARANIDVTQKNYIINGAMLISQENGGAVGSTSGYHPADQWAIGSAGTSGVYSIALVSLITPGGSVNRLRTTVTTADAAVAAGDIAHIYQRIEGLFIPDLMFGTAAAKTITIQFGVKAPAGTYCVAVLNGTPGNRSYVAEYVISAGEANTDVVKSVTIPGDTAGTWAISSLNGLEIRFALMGGTTWQQAAGSWGTGNVVCSANQFNLFGTVGNVFELFDVSLTKGSVAPPFQVPDYASELTACMRYWRKFGGAQQVVFFDGWSGSVGMTLTGSFHHPGMRAAPIMTVTGPSSGAGTGAPVFTPGVDVSGMYLTTSLIGRVYWYNNAGGYVTASARL